MINFKIKKTLFNLKIVKLLGKVSISKKNIWNKNKKKNKINIMLKIVTAEAIIVKDSQNQISSNNYN